MLLPADIVFARNGGSQGGPQVASARTSTPTTGQGIVAGPEETKARTGMFPPMHKSKHRHHKTYDGPA
jgi:hypothetical protein